MKQDPEQDASGPISSRSSETLRPSRQASIESAPSQRDYDGEHSSDAGSTRVNQKYAYRSGMPHAIKRLEPIRNLLVPMHPQCFTKIAIKSILGGIDSDVSNGFYSATKSRTGLSREIKGYYLLDPDTQIFSPRCPVQHGAIISNLLWPSDESPKPSNIPLFVKDNDGLYEYFGDYSEPRYSDLMGYNEMVSAIPEKVVKWHAKYLSEKKDGRKPKAAIAALKNQWQRKTLRFDQEGKSNLKPYHKSDDWDQGAICSVPITDEEAEELGYEEIMAAFYKAYFDEPSMRLYWEYLQAVGYDKEFNLSMIARKQELGL